MSDTKPKKEKSWPKGGRGLGDVTYFSILVPLISLEWLKIQTSNFACVLSVMDGKPEKNVKKGRCLDHVSYFSNFGPTNISGTAKDTNLKICMQIGREGYYTEK